MRLAHSSAVYVALPGTRSIFFDILQVQVAILSNLCCCAGSASIKSIATV